MALPRLPAKAAYIHLTNIPRRNALSLGVLDNLRRQLHHHLRDPETNQPALLPPFEPHLLDALTHNNHLPQYKWLTHDPTWRARRAHLPQVLVLRSIGPVFSAGHDLHELASVSHDEAREIFALCAEVMTLIRRSPALVVAPIQGIATAAGFQLAMTADVPIALGTTKFQLPGMGLGLPCVSPAVAVSRRIPPGLSYRLFATAETITASELASTGALDVVPVPEHAESTDTAKAAFEKRVEEVITRLANETPARAQALGKWAFWTQMAMREGGGDGYEAAARWGGRIMALLAKGDEAKEGIGAWAERRKPSWAM